MDEHRSFWLRGYRGVLGLAYLTLVPAGLTVPGHRQPGGSLP